MADTAPATTSVVQYSAVETGLAELRSRMVDVVYDVTTAKGMEQARKDRRECVALRTSLEEVRKREKAGILERGRLLDGEAKRICQAIAAIEAPIDAAIKSEESRKEQEKAERDRIERERVDGIRSIINAIRTTPVDAVGKSAKVITRMRDAIASTVVTHERFAEFTEDAANILQAVLESLDAMIADKLAHEAEGERLRLERERLASEEAAAKTRRDEEDRIRQEANAAEEKRLTDQRLTQEAEAARLKREAAALEEQRQEQERQRVAEEQRQENDRHEREVFQERAAKRAERMKAAKCKSPGDALLAIFDVIHSPVVDDAAAREEVRIICDANLPKRQQRAA